LPFLARNQAVIAPDGPHRPNREFGFESFCEDIRRRVWPELEPKERLCDEISSDKKGVRPWNGEQLISRQ
jgi:hypothetical protein